MATDRVSTPRFWQLCLFQGLVISGIATVFVFWWFFVWQWWVLPAVFGLLWATAIAVTHYRRRPAAARVQHEIAELPPDRLETTRNGRHEQPRRLLVAFLVVAGIGLFLVGLLLCLEIAGPTLL